MEDWGTSTTRPFLVLLIKPQPSENRRREKRELELGEERERGKSNRIQPGRSVRDREEGGGIGAGARHGGPERGGSRLQPLHLQRAAPRGLFPPALLDLAAPLFRSGCDSSRTVVLASVVVCGSGFAHCCHWIPLLWLFGSDLVLGFDYFKFYSLSNSFTSNKIIPRWFARLFASRVILIGIASCLALPFELATYSFTLYRM